MSKPTVSERFWSRVDTSMSCWNWRGARSRFGYGKMVANGRYVDAHRLSYMLTKGDIPEGMMVCHRCDNPSCVKPDHLFIGSPSDNMVDMASKKRRRSQQRLKCRNGHAFTPENTIHRGLFGRRCRTCKRISAHYRNIRLSQLRQKEPVA